MNFIADYTTLNDLLTNNKTWKLLRADRAPLILAFLKNLFNNETEVSYGSARANLIEFLKQLEPDLNQADFENIVKIRFDPIEKNYINCNINEITSNLEPLSFKDNNA